MNAPSDRARLALAALGAVSTVLLATRLLAAMRVGFGDSEALYASYALHPQPAYLDHPGLVGLVARLIGGGTAPTPQRAHLVTALVATAFPWLMALTCRAAGSPWSGALGGALVAALAPEIAVGLFAMTPDLLLAMAWTGSLGLAAWALRSIPGSGRGALAFAGAGLLAGVAAASKVTGLALFGSLAATYLSLPARPHARSLAPWAGLAAGAVVLSPIVVFESHSGWPMLRHRLIDTQVSAGVSLRNVGALLGGQLVYLSPLVVWLAALAVREAWHHREDDAVGRLLWLSFVVPAAALLPLCLWSRVAEPHWLAPALLALVPAAARAVAPPMRLLRASCLVGATMVAAAYVWVLVPSAVLLTPVSYDPRLDISSELYGWAEAIDAVRDEVKNLSVEGDVEVVGPHWVVCAQLEAALRGTVPVGCDTTMPDDFDTWWPRARWRTADIVVWVSDARFGPPSLASYAPLHQRLVRIERAGRTARVFTITVLAKRVQA